MDLGKRPVSHEDNKMQVGFSKELGHDNILNFLTIKKESIMVV